MGHGLLAHPTTLAAAEELPAEVEVDAPLTFAVQAACPHGCDLRGLRIEVADAGGVLASGALAGHDGTSNLSDEIELRAPREVGEYTWTLRLPRHEGEAVVHEESTLPVRFRTVPHACSLTAWGAPGPVAAGGALSVHVGLRCGRACKLAGARVALLDDAGAQVAEGVLGETPWPATEALYWTRLEAQAPAAEGAHAWTVVLVEAGTALAHEAQPAPFGFRTGKPCEHRAAVRVLAAAGRTPVAGVQVRVGPYAATTAADGVAAVEVPPGEFAVTIRKDGFTAPPLAVAVDGDVALDIEVRAAPTRAELRERAIRNFPWG